MRIRNKKRDNSVSKLIRNKLALLRKQELVIPVAIIIGVFFLIVVAASEINLIGDEYGI